MDLVMVVIRESALRYTCMNIPLYTHINSFHIKYIYINYMSKLKIMN